VTHPFPTSCHLRHPRSGGAGDHRSGHQRGPVSAAGDSAGPGGTRRVPM